VPGKPDLTFRTLPAEDRASGYTLPFLRFLMSTIQYRRFLDYLESMGDIVLRERRYTVEVKIIPRLTVERFLSDK
jgi:hypothetical protein